MNAARRAHTAGSTYVVATLSDRPNVHDSARVRVHPLANNGDARPASRPTFDVATEADRAPFADGVAAPPNLKGTVRTTTTLVALSTIRYASP